MRTDDMIAAMVADNATRSRPIGEAMAIALGVGALSAISVFFLIAGFRPDIAEAINSPRFVFKFVVTLALALPAILIVRRLSRPGDLPKAALASLLVAPMMLLAAVAIELLTIQNGERISAILGQNAFICLTIIPIVAIGPLGVLITGLRHGAPTSPVLAGALAGLASAAIAATLYASHCNNDSPLFVAVWYSLAALIMTTIGALAGRVFLRW